MQPRSHIPLFPLSLLPLPGELVPLHIFEPRYRQLLQDAETLDVHFGIYCNHDLNKERIGSLMKLESILKRYPTGESDIVVRCVDIFTMDKMLRTYKSKLYPGGEVVISQVDVNEPVLPALYAEFMEYQQKRNIHTHNTLFNIFQIALELNLDLFDRYKFLTFSHEKRTAFLMGQLKFQLCLLDKEEKSKDLYHLN